MNWADVLLASIEGIEGGGYQENRRLFPYTQVHRLIFTRAFQPIRMSLYRYHLSFSSGLLSYLHPGKGCFTGWEKLVQWERLSRLWEQGQFIMYSSWVYRQKKNLTAVT